MCNLPFFFRQGQCGCTTNKKWPRDAIGNDVRGKRRWPCSAIGGAFDWQPRSFWRGLFERKLPTCRYWKKWKNQQKWGIIVYTVKFFYLSKTYTWVLGKLCKYEKKEQCQTIKFSFQIETAQRLWIRFVKLANEKYKIVLSRVTIPNYTLKYKSLTIAMQSLMFIKQFI